MPRKLAASGRNRILDRDIKVAEANLPSWLTEAALGESYSPAVHTHVSTAITDATDTGRAVLTATDAPAARAAIGAGTSSLVLGSGASNAMAGDRVFDHSEITGTVPTSALPPLAINETFPVADQAAMLALTAQRGDMAIRSDNGRTYVLSTDSPTTLADWKEVMAAGQVQSVAGKTGVVSLVKGDVGLGSVDNTADSAKPVSTAQQTALDLKINTSAKGAASGVASLDANSFIPLAQNRFWATTVNIAISSATGGTAAVTFPASRFATVPIVIVSKQSGSLAKYVPYAANITTTGCTVGIFSGDGSTSTGNADVSALVIPTS